MKTLIIVITVTAALALPSRGARPRLIPPNPDTQAAVEEALATPEAATQESLEKAKEQLDETQSQIEKQVAETEAQIAQLEAQATSAAAAAEASEAAAVAGDLPGLENRLQSVIKHSSGHGGKALVIRSSEPDPKEQSNLEEDLAVMSHILDKALEEKNETTHRTHRAMGINVYFGSSNPMRSLYLDGYGAVFMLNVGFPLLAPPKGDARKEKTETSSTWEEARQELYGQPAGAKTLAGPVEEYDEEKVNQLKDTLLEALKNAANIRDLKPDDSVTICVFGGAGAGRAQVRSTMKRGATPAADVQNQVWVLGDHNVRPTRGTILTIRVKKSDADAFAKDKLTLEEFRKKAKITVYIGNADGGMGGMGFGSGFGSSSGFSYDFGPFNQGR